MADADTRSETVTQRVTLAVIVGAHGVHGAMRVKSFGDDPLALDQYGALTDASGTAQFDLTMVKPDKAGARIKIKGITTREAAAAMKGTQLCVARAQLPKLDEDEAFYHADLIGLRAETADGAHLGHITGVHNFGAGDLLDIDGTLLPFTKACVPKVDLAAGLVRVVVPSETEARPPEQQKPADDTP